MLHYGTLETEIASKLNAFFAANSLSDYFFAVPIPENENEIQAVLKETVTRSAAMISYNTSGYADTMGHGGVSQEEDVLIRIIFIGPKMRGDNGVYGLIRWCKIALLGWQPTNCSKKFTVKKFDLAEFQHFGVQMHLDIQTGTVIVQQAEQETILGASFVQATYRETLLT